MPGGLVRMSRRWNFRRWGLQRRIMAYVAIGLLAVSGTFLYLGLRAVDQSTQLVFDERLAIAQNVAAALARETDHLIPDVEEQVVALTSDADVALLEATVADTYAHLTTADDFVFFSIDGVWLVDDRGESLAAAPRSAALNKTPPSLPPSEPSEDRARLVWPEEAGSGRFLTVVVPLLNEDGSVWARMLVDTRGRNTRENFVPSGFRVDREDEGYVAPISEYHMEVVGPAGTVILGVGPDEEVGARSVHFEVISDWVRAGVSGTTLHTAEESGGAETHLMAAVPVPSSPLYLVIEQDEDVALAVPDQFRRQVLLISVIGFVATLSVAWVTTRRVVRPTELLTAAAEQMAAGELSTPIRVDAQDEIGVLAEHLEVMRQQLQRALTEVETANSELESRVQERTRQLEELVHRVLTVQEDERRRVALELHDDTAQALTALSMRLDAVARKDERLEPEIAEELREAHQMAGSTLEGVRRMINALGPAALERRGVGAALHSYAEEFLARSEMEIEFDVPAARRRLPENVELTLYRIGQEALNNAVGHSQATRVQVTLVHDEHAATLTVTDDGVGFEVANPVRANTGSRGLGIAGMRERARLVNGSFAIESTPGRGTTVRVEVPVSTDD